MSTGTSKPTVSEQIKHLCDTFPIGSKIKHKRENPSGVVKGYRKGGSLSRQKRNGPEAVMIVDTPGDTLLYYQDEVLLVEKSLE